MGTLISKLKTINKPKIKAKKSEKKKVYKTNADGDFLLEGDEALLLAEGCKLNKEIKSREKKFKKIKDKLKFTEKGEYLNTAGDKVVVSISDKKSDIDPLRLFNVMVKNKLKSRFWGCVKVQVGEIKKVIPQTAIDKMQTALDPIVKCSFK